MEERICSLIEFIAGWHPALLKSACPLPCLHGPCSNSLSNVCLEFWVFHVSLCSVPKALEQSIACRSSGACFGRRAGQNAAFPHEFPRWGCKSLYSWLLGSLRRHLISAAMLVQGTFLFSCMEAKCVPCIMAASAEPWVVGCVRLVCVCFRSSPVSVFFGSSRA